MQNTSATYFSQPRLKYLMINVINLSPCDSRLDNRPYLHYPNEKPASNRIYLSVAAVKRPVEQKAANRNNCVS